MHEELYQSPTNAFRGVGDNRTVVGCQMSGVFVKYAAKKALLSYASGATGRSVERADIKSSSDCETHTHSFFERERLPQDMYVVTTTW